MVLVSFFHEDRVGRFPQVCSLLVREGSIANLYKIMVEGCVGVLWRTDGHNGEVQVFDGVGRD